MIEANKNKSEDIRSYTWTQPSTPPKKHMLRNIIMSAAILLLAMGISIIIFRIIQHNSMIDTVKKTLITQNSIMKNSVKDSVYSATLPEAIKSTNKVHITAAVAFDGASYCISGRSLEDHTIVYSISSQTAAAVPEVGDCQSEVDTYVPSKPAPPSVSSVGADNINLTWNSVNYARTYKARCATDGLFTKDLVVVTTNKDFVTVPGLKSGTMYYCGIQAANTIGESKWSEVVLAHVALFSVAPNNLKVTPISTSEISYSWDTVPGAKSYELEYTDDIDFINNVKKITTQSTNGRVTGLNANTMYYFHVRVFTNQFNANNAAYSGPVEDKTKNNLIQ